MSDRPVPPARPITPIADFPEKIGLRRRPSCRQLAQWQTFTRKLAARRRQTAKKPGVKDAPEQA